MVKTLVLIKQRMGNVKLNNASDLRWTRVFYMTYMKTGRFYETFNKTPGLTKLDMI